MLAKLFRRRDKAPNSTKEMLNTHLGVLTRSYRRKNLVFSLSVSVAMMIMMYNFVYTDTDSAERTSDHIAKITLQGTVSTANEQGNGMNIAQALKEAMENPHAKAILIEANSGGGSPVQAEIINSAIHDAKAKRDHRIATLSEVEGETPVSTSQYDKPILVVTTDMCASACYLSVSQADRIISHPSSLVGSIGVRIDAWQLSDALTRVGINKVTFASTKDKTLLDPFVAMTEKQKDLVQSEMIEPIYDLFVEAVRAARGDKLSGNDEELFSGRVFHGRKAMTLGLVDEISTMNKVVEKLKKDYAVAGVVTYNEKPFSIKSIIQSSFDQAIMRITEGAISVR